MEDKLPAAAHASDELLVPCDHLHNSCPYVVVLFSSATLTKLQKREHKVRAHCYAKLLVRAPLLVMLISAGVVIGLGVAAFLAHPFIFDAGGQGFAVRDDVVAERNDANNAAGGIFADAEVVPWDFTEPERSVAASGIVVLIVSRPEGANVLTDAAVQVMRDLEEGIYNLTGHSELCHLRGGACSPPFSLTQATSADTPVAESVVPLSRFFPSLLEFALDKNFSVAESRINSTVLRSAFSFGFPLPPFNRSDVNFRIQNARVAKWVEDRLTPFINEFTAKYGSDDLEILITGSALSDARVLSLILGDATWAIAAFGFIIFYLTFHLQSLLLSISGLFQILMSFPGAYFFYRVCLGVERFNSINMLSIFVILSVGADDIFLITDRWKQSRHQNFDTLEERMTFTFNHAASAMLVTSLTTSVAFFANSISPIPTIRLFGLFAGFLIVMNYLLVISFFASILVLWTKCGLEECCFFKKRIYSRKQEPMEEGSDDRPLDVSSYRVLERYFYTWHSEFVRNYKVVLLCVTVALLAVFIGFASQLGPASEPDQFLPPDDPLSKISRITSTFFRETDSATRIELVWGLKTIDRSGTNINDVSDLGSPVFDDGFTMQPAENQLYLLEVCRAVLALNTTRTLNATPVTCVMHEFQRYRESLGLEFPVGPRENIDAALRQFANSRWSSAPRLWRTLRFTPEGRLMLLRIVVNTTIGNEPAVVTRSFFDEYEAFMRGVNEAAPATLTKGFHTGRKWVQMASSEALVRIAVVGVGVSLALAAAIVTLLTCNYCVSALAMLCVVCVVVFILGVMVAIGYQLGVIESISITILVGLAVDYVLHLALAYQHAHQYSTRHHRTRHALFSVGISVFSAWVTSMGGSMFLLGARTLFFFKFGVFLVLTTVCSSYMTFVLFVSLTEVMGPENDTGDLLKCCGRGRGGKPASLPEQVMVVEEQLEEDHKKQWQQEGWVIEMT